ncbi:L,D-transpeptidase [Rhizobium halophytocola]|uniref:Lipoprotein-anchoring transpeptidase ErfK/SrfK n=1 Tax=Rhizobium halophytocola TaxID=735519 RepID=A0ABS4DZK6_9HYPH|nr:L,D-transpeptidase [Rhizobium halophytocola]MBP1851123.1 lipoprotein-anchoring transpeptidase ErfK/SrfK [Rhizobium halophytocola]
MSRISIFAAAFCCLFFYAVLAEAGGLVARISLRNQTLTLVQNGVVTDRWKVSTARRGYVTPRGSYGAKWLSRHHRSRKYDNAPMPYAIFFKGGYAVHATYDLKRLGRPASHGCVRLHPDNAARLFSMTQRYGLANTRIVITQ